MSYTATNQPVRAPPLNSDYELIDGDPYFTRVVSYFRFSDYVNWYYGDEIMGKNCS